MDSSLKRCGNDYREPPMQGRGICAHSSRPRSESLVIVTMRANIYENDIPSYDGIARRKCEKQCARQPL